MKENGDSRWLNQLQGSGLAAQLIRGGIGSLLARGAEVLLGLAAAVLLARLLGASGYGVYTFALALVSLAVLPAQAGLPPLVVRETARGEQLSDWSTVSGIWRWANCVALSLSLLIAAVGALGLWLGWAQSETLREALAWALGLLPLMALVAIRLASLRGLRHVLAGALPEQVLRPAFLSSALLIPWIFSSATVTPGDAMALTLGSAFVAFFAGTWLLRRYRPPEVVTANPHYQHKAWLAAAWPMALTQGFQRLNRYADVLLLGLLAATVDVGVYRVAAQGAMLVSLGLAALDMVFAPYATRLHAEQEQQKLQKLVRHTAQAALVFALPAMGMFIVLGEWLLVTLFGNEFRGAYWPLLILASGQLISAWFGPTGQLLTMTGYEREVTRAAAMAAGLNIVLGVLLIPPFTAIGAAIATSASLVLWNVWLWRVARHRLGIRCSVAW